MIDGLGWMTDSLQAYFYPNANLKYLFITFLGELVFMLWLLIGGWRIREPQSAPPPAPLSDVGSNAVVAKA